MKGYYKGKIIDEVEYVQMIQKKKDKIRNFIEYLFLCGLGFFIALCIIGILILR